MREGLNDDVVEVDGARGEGGGQILRTSLALSMITGRPLRMQRIRANRAKGGLRRQHLACVNAAAELCAAEIRGAHVDSSAIEMIPKRSFDDWPSELVVDIGTVGSTSLVLQTILVPMIVARRTFRVTVLGGTHNPMAPPFDFLDRVFVPQLHAMGARVTLTLDRHGFATGKGPTSHHDATSKHLGQVTAVVEPGELRPIEIVDGGPVTSRHAVAILARLPTHVAERELAVVQEQLGWSPAECETREVAASGTGNVLHLEVERAGCRELVTEFGQQGVRAELVAERAVHQMRDYLAHGAPVGEHLADQLLLPMAVARGGRFRAGALSLHATTNIETIQQFVDVPITVEPADGTSVVRVGS